MSFDLLIFWNTVKDDFLKIIIPIACQRVAEIIERCYFTFFRNRTSNSFIPVPINLRDRNDIVGAFNSVKSVQRFHSGTGIIIKRENVAKQGG